jgi:hypothetical protein
MPNGRLRRKQMEGIRKAAPAERLIGVTARAGFGNFILKGVKYTDGG